MNMKSSKMRVLSAGAVMALAISPVFAIDVYQSQELQPRTGKAADVFTSKEVQPYRSGEIDVYRAPAVEEYKGAGPDKPVSGPVREKPKTPPGKVSTGVTIIGCKNVRCDTREGIMPGLTTVEIEGGFPSRAGDGLLLRIFDTQTKKVIDSRKVGIEASGKLLATIPAYRYPAATYGFVFTPANDLKHVLASGRLSTSRTEDRGTNNRHTTGSPDRSFAGQGGAPSAASVVGTWYGTASTVGTIVLRPDGTYEYGGNAGGSYTLENGGIAFTGKLAAWNNGHATLKNGNLEFTWTTAEGWHQWFSFAK